MTMIMKADDEYKRLLKVMERDPSFCQEEIEMFKATELVRKSIDLVKLKAKGQADKRHSPEDMKYVESRVKRNFEMQESISPVAIRRTSFSPKRHNLSLSYISQPAKKVPPAKKAPPKPEEPYNPFQITDLEMKRIKQSVHLTDESLKKLYEREQQIKHTEADLIHIQKKIERSKLEKQRGRRSKPFKMPKPPAGPINEDCLNISVEGVHQMQGNSNFFQIGGTALSQINQDQS